MSNSKTLSQNSRLNPLIIAALFLVTFSFLMYEILLTRLFSAILTYNLVFLVVSLSIFGLGLGGMIFYNFRIQQHKSYLAIISAITPLVILITVSAIYFLPYIGYYPVYAILGAIPFLFGGYILSTIFKLNAQKARILYFIDLAGSALGSLYIILSLNKYGFILSVLIISLLLYLAALLLNIYEKRMRNSVLVSIPFILILALLIQGNWIRNLEQQFNAYYSNPNKAFQYLKLSNAKPLGVSFSKWDAISKTDVIETTDPNTKIIVTDGGAEAPLTKFNGNLSSVSYLKKESRFIPYTFGENNSSLIIGSGGGLDVLMALLGNAKKVDAVEINPSTVDAVNYFKDYSGDIYNRPGVSLYNQDGRNFINNTEKKYDNINLAMVMTNSIENNMFALSENYIFTYEAFNQYLSHLNNNGKLSFMVHNVYEMVKIVNTGIKALMDKGIKQGDVTKYFVIIAEPDSHAGMSNDSIVMPLIIFKNTPFQADEINSLKQAVSERNKLLLQSPDNSRIDVYQLLAASQINYEQLIDATPFNSKPIYDNSPFIHNYSKSIPGSLLFLLVLCIVIWLLIKKIYISRKIRLNTNLEVYFGSLGIAYMLIELPIIQKMTLYFGTPSLAFSLVLFSLLLSSGTGSLVSETTFAQKNILIKNRYFLLIGVSILLVFLSFNSVEELVSNMAITYKVIISFIMISLMGLFMGIPFPDGIAKMSQFEEQVPLIWGINSFFSVIGSILALVLSMLFGFNITAGIGLLIYMFLYINNPLKNIANWD